ncbi:type II secretion system F family protein [Aerococcaceae bacterium NML191219]|nr:type II secretion system F family protein [Aerococcaceae bacterium NML191219]
MATLIQRLLNILKWNSARKSTAMKLPKKYHAYFLKTLAELLEQGFSLNQALDFMQLLMPDSRALLQGVLAQLGKGEPFEKCIQPLGYGVPVVAQLFYAQRQGRFIQALKDNAAHLQRMHDYRHKIIRLLSYPLLMGVFLVALLFGMRNFMLPHIMSFISPRVYEENLLVQGLVWFFTYLPQILITTTAVFIIILTALDVYLMRISYFKRYRLMCRLPFSQKWCRWFCTYKVAKELGYFFEACYSLQQLLDVLIQYPVDPFLAEMAQFLWRELARGHALTAALESCGIFTREFAMVVYQGELTSQTASKCLVYADKLLNDLLTDLSKKLAYVQPILFILIAVLVLAMYLMMLLPMLTMDGF